MESDDSLWWPLKGTAERERRSYVSETPFSPYHPHLHQPPLHTFFFSKTGRERGGKAMWSLIKESPHPYDLNHPPWVSFCRTLSSISIQTSARSFVINPAFPLTHEPHTSLFPGCSFNTPPPVITSLRNWKICIYKGTHSLQVEVILFIMCGFINCHIYHNDCKIWSRKSFAKKEMTRFDFSDLIWE